MLVLLIGLGMRIWILRHAAGAIDSDEAAAGLMARAFARGSFSTFFWGQQYGGTLEPMLVGAFFRVAGSSRIALKLIPIALSGVSAALVWRIGRRAINEHAGRIAGALCWIWPTAYVWWSTKERGFYWVALTLGLGIVLLVLRLDEHPRRHRDWALLGSAIGLGWWTSPQIALFAIPAGGWLAWRLRRDLWPGVAVAAGTALVGSLPWWRANLLSDWASLDTASQSDHRGLLAHLWSVVHHGLPTALGLRHVYTERWILGPVGPALFVALLALAAAGGIRAWRASDCGRVIVIAALGTLILLAFAPNTEYVGEGRYELFVWPFLALLLAAAATGIQPRQFGAPRFTVSALLGPALVAAGAVLTITTLGPLNEATLPHAPDVHVPADMKPLVHTLEAHRLTTVYADYWLAYRVTFESSERIIATPFASVRWRPYDDTVRQSACPVYAFVTTSGSLDVFGKQLAALGVTAQRLRAGLFTVVIPDRAVTPQEASTGAQSSATRTGRNVPSCHRANV